MLVAAAWAQAEPDPRRLTDVVVPMEQRITLDLDPAATAYSGQVDVVVEVRERVSSFVLHAEDLELGPGSLSRGGRPEPVALTPEGSRVRVTPRRPLKPGRYTLTLPFRNDFGGDVGLYRHVSDDGHAYLVTQLEPDEARSAWPAFDEPRFKLPWELVVTAPADAVVLTGAAPVSRTVEDGRQRVVTRLPRLSSYLVALAVGPFVSTPLEDGVPGAVWTLPGRADRATYVAAEAPRHLRFLEDWFGRPSPYPKIDFLAVPHFTYGAMENPGLIVGRERLFLVPADATEAERRRTSSVVAHELAHFWFGDLVTLAWWDELWLNESFADWMAAKSQQAANASPLDAADELRGASGSLAQDALPSARPLTGPVDPDHVFETTNLGQAYTKGGAILDAMEAWLGPEVFRAGIQALVRDHAEGVITGADVVTALSAASGREVGPVFTPWVEHPGAPRLDLTRDAAGRWSVTVNRFGGEGEAPWVVPLRVLGPDGRSAEVLAAGPVTALPGLDGADWVWPTPDAIGYFVWTLPPGALRALVAVPRGPVEQLALVTNLARLRETGGLSLVDELELLRALPPAPPLVAEAALGAWDELVAVAPPARAPEVAERLRQAWGPALERITWEEVPGESADTGALRARLVSTLGGAGEHAGLRAEAKRKVGAWLAGAPITDRETFGAWLWLAASLGDDALQLGLLERWRAETDLGLRTEWLSAAASVPTATARERSLELALGDELDSRARDRVLGGVFADEARHDERLAWSIAHHDFLVERTPPPWRMYLAGNAGGCDEARMERGAAFYAGRAELPGVDAVLDELRAGTAACASRRARERPAVEAWLNHTPPG
jgi:alanyl aminopeptidase